MRRPAVVEPARRWVRDHRRGATSTAVLGIGIIGVIVAMFLADGFRARNFELQDGAVWVTNESSGQHGRINALVRAQDRALVIGEKDARLEVVQDGRAVFAVSDGKVARIPADTATPQELGQLEPADTWIGLGGDRLVAATPTGEVRLGTVDQPEGALVGGGDPAAKLGSGAVVAVGRDGRVVGYSREADELVEIGRKDSEPQSTGLADGAPADGTPQIALVGDRAVVLLGDRIFIEGDGARDLPDEIGLGLRLQQSGERSDHVLIAGSGGFLRVPLGGGDAQRVNIGSVTITEGTPLAEPVRVGGCEHWAAGGGVQLYVIQCDGAEAILLPLSEARPGPGQVDPTEELRFRTNRNHVVLNAVRTGAVFQADGTELFQIDDWADDDDTPDDEQDQEDTQQPQVLDLSRENTPPTANPDFFGARPGIATPLAVLDNDTDPDSDLLTVDVVADSVSPAGTAVGVIANGQAVQVTAPDGVPSVSFTYTVTDGRSEPESAQVSVKVVGADVNTAPRLKEKAAREIMTLEAGTSASDDISQDYTDDEGDPILLASATVAPPDVVVADPTGTVTFTDNGTTAASKVVSLEVRDVPPDGVEPAAPFQHERPVLVVGRGDPQPPTLRPDYAVTLAGQSVVIQPLANDVDPNGDVLRLVKVETPPDWAGRPAPDIVLNTDGTIRFAPQAAPEAVGSYVFGYVASDGSTDPVTGLIRVDVRQPANRPPTAGRDLVVLPISDTSSRTVDLLANDVDPDGDVLVVQSVDVPPGSGLQARLLDRRRLRITASGQLPAPALIRYRVSDGQAAAEGQVVVTSARIDGSLLNPVVRPDTVTVRAGDLVTIPVLANDLDPLGADLHLMPALPVPPAAGQGDAWVSGRNVRFLAPTSPGRVEFTYGVTRTPEQPQEVASGAVVVTVAAATDQNAPPVPRTVEARVLAGGSVRIAIPLAGIDPDGDSVSLVGLSAGGNQLDYPELGRVVTPVGVDSITYEAFENAGGTDTFAYEVRDRRGLLATGYVRVGVVPRDAVNQKPAAIDDRILIRPGGTARIPVLANDYDPDDDPIAIVDGSVTAGGGVEATVDGTSVVVTAPGSIDPVPPVGYTIADPSGLRASARIDIVVSPDAPGQPPIARDDEVRSFDPADEEVEVDVLANDEDPDGEITEVRVVGDRAGVRVDGRRLVVTPGDAAQLVPYTITDDEGLAATAVVRVPPRGVNQPPEAVELDGPIEVKQGEGAKEIPLDSVVRDPEGRTVILTLEDRVRAANSDGSGLVKDRTTLQFTPKPDYAGPASITFEVTDGADANDPAGATAVISVPIKVISDRNLPPTWRSAPVVEVAPRESAQRIELAASVEDPEEDDLTFTVDDTGKPDGSTVELDGSELVVGAGSATPAGEYRIAVAVTDGQAGEGRPAASPVVLRVLTSIRPEPTCSPIVLGDASAGEEIEVDVAASCTNPYPDSPLELVGAEGPVQVATGGTTLRFTPPRGTVGDVTVSFEVSDAIQRRAGGTVTARIRDVPSTPTAPAVTSVESRQVTLSWTAPAANGAPIEFYDVRWEGGSQECPSTSCVITGLQNDVSYRFAVVAHNAVGDSEPSDLSAPARPDQRPEAPGSVTLRFDPAQPDGKLVAEWTASRSEGSPVTGYLLDVSPPPPTGASQVRTGPETTALLTGLENGTNYVVQVRAVNSAATGPSDPTTSNTESPARPPAAVARPNAARVFSVLGGVASVQWSAPADTGGAAIDTYTVVGFVGGGETVRVEVPGTQTSAQLDGLNREATYQFAVIANNKAGSSEPSPRSADVQPGGVPERITNLTATAAAANGVTGLDRRVQLTFTPPPTRSGGPVEFYRVSVSGAARDLPPALPLVVTGLTNGTQYSFQVLGCTAIGCADQTSNSVSATPYGPVPAPTIRAVAADQGGVTFDIRPSGTNGRSIREILVPGRAPLPASGGLVSVATSCGQSVTVSAVAVDLAGQQSSASSGSGSASACPLPPPPTASDLIVVTYGGGEVGVAFNAAWTSPTQEPITCRFFIDGVLRWGPGQCGTRPSNRFFGIPAGSHQFYATVTDAFGQVGTSNTVTRVTN